MLEATFIYEYLGSVITNNEKLDMAIAKSKKVTNVYRAINKTTRETLN